MEKSLDVRNSLVLIFVLPDVQTACIPLRFTSVLCFFPSTISTCGFYPFLCLCYGSPDRNLSSLARMSVRNGYSDWSRILHLHVTCSLSSFRLTGRCPGKSYQWQRIQFFFSCTPLTKARCTFKAKLLNWVPNHWEWKKYMSKSISARRNRTRVWVGLNIYSFININEWRPFKFFYTPKYGPGINEEWRKQQIVEELIFQWSGNCRWMCWRM